MAPLKPSRIREGTAEKHGAIWDGKGTDFMCFSAHATRVEVCLFDPHGEKELERLILPEYTDGFWHGYIPDVHDLVQFTLPGQTGGAAWRLLVDTNVPEQDEQSTFGIGEVYGVTGRSLLLFVLE
jgi:Carbohydrate-binding module 48 (Isoamylase N-terminal domain)